MLTPNVIYTTPNVIKNIVGNNEGNDVDDFTEEDYALDEARDSANGEFFWPSRITKCVNCGCSECVRVRGGIECAECGKFYRIQ